MATATNGTISLSYEYDLDGLRTRKTVGNAVHDYYYAGGRLLREVITTTAEDETVTTTTLDFFYDASGMPYVLKYNGVEYYYITNLQGDVVSIVDPTSGVPVATYEYDPFGKVVSATGTMAEINPLRYRGYYYDTETGFYYLQSRYYDPAICRFINADSFASTGQGLLGYNMFAYCGNNPIMGVDPTGYWNWGGFWVGVATIVVGVVIIAATVASAGTAAPLAAAAISTIGTAVGTAVTATGAVTAYAAATETPMVADVSVTDGATGDKHGYSVVIDFDANSVSFDTYYHYGRTSSKYSAAYGVGFVYGYDEPGDYGGFFIDGTASYTHNGIDYGIDVCTDPSEPFSKCSAALLTVGVSEPTSRSVNFSVDCYVPISCIEWK